jgi:hypothetical protein
LVSFHRSSMTPNLTSGQILWKAPSGIPWLRVCRRGRSRGTRRNVSHVRLSALFRTLRFVGYSPRVPVG